MKNNDDYDAQVKCVGLMVGISYEVYHCSLSKTSSLYMEFINNKWVAWRENYVMNSNKRISHKIIAQGNFEEVINRVDGYLRFMERIKNREGD